MNARVYEFKGKCIDGAQLILQQTCLAWSPFIHTSLYPVAGDGLPLLSVTAKGYAFSTGEEVLLDVLAAMSTQDFLFQPSLLRRLDPSTAATAYAALGVAFVPAMAVA